MKYFLDTEFLEGKQKKLFGFTKPTIDLISIGIISEHRHYEKEVEYYAISNAFNVKEAWNRYQMEDGKKVYWLRDNVLRSVFNELARIGGYRFSGSGTSIPECELDFNLRNMQHLVRYYGKDPELIAKEVKNFCLPITNYDYDQTPEFFGYFADYDWVVFCWLFGKMIDLPEGFPYYCKDLKQMLDEKLMADTGGETLLRSTLPPVDVIQIRMRGTLKEKLKWIKEDCASYPRQWNEHNALADARWNHELYKFIQKL